MLILTMKSVKGRKISLPWFRQSSVQKSHAALSRQHTIDNCTAKSFEGSKNLQVQILFSAVLMKYGSVEIKIHDEEFFLLLHDEVFMWKSHYIYAIIKLLLIFCVLFLPVSPMLSQTGIVETTWVVADFVSAQGSTELSVQKGQQVEVIDTNCVGAPEFCLVRLVTTTTNNNVSSTSLSSTSLREQVQEGLVPTSILKPPPLPSKAKKNGEGDEGKVSVDFDCSWFYFY